jgi:lipoprotein signal peptidase
VSGIGGSAFVEASTSALIWFAVDRWTKHLATHRLGKRIVDFGRIGQLRRVAVRRPGGRAGVPVVLAVVWCVALGCAIVLRSHLGWFASRGAVFGLGAAFGGAAGNLLDLIRRRPIVDFVDVRWWPVFNVADIAIVGGLLAAFLIRG